MRCSGADKGVMTNPNQNAHACLSKEAANRVMLWEEALENALNYLKAGDHLVNKPDAMGDRIEYEIAGLPGIHMMVVPHIARAGLTEAAVVLTRQVFSQGAEGPGIAANLGNPEVDAFRDKMERELPNRLGWTEAEYQATRRLIRNRRNEQLAHYDGSAAEYVEVSPELTTLKMVGANLNPEERQKLESMATAMLQFIFEKIAPEAYAQHIKTQEVLQQLKALRGN